MRGFSSPLHAAFPCFDLPSEIRCGSSCTITLLLMVAHENEYEVKRTVLASMEKTGSDDSFARPHAGSDCASKPSGVLDREIDKEIMLRRFIV
jgi:hypothetical protein